MDNIATAADPRAALVRDSHPSDDIDPEDVYAAFNDGGGGPPSPAAQPTGTPKPSVLRRGGPTPNTPAAGGSFLSRLGAALRGGIDAAATPNIAYGGPTDIFRGMQAAQLGAQARNATDAARARQTRIDEIEAQKTGAEIERDRAVADANRAHAASYAALAGQREDPHKDDREIIEEVGKYLGLKPDADGRYYIPKASVSVLMKPAHEQPQPHDYEGLLISRVLDPNTTPEVKQKSEDELKVLNERKAKEPTSTDAKIWALRDIVMDPSSTPDQKKQAQERIDVAIKDNREIHPKQNLDFFAPQREPKAPVATPQQFANVENRKAVALQRAEESARRRLTEAAGFGGRVDPAIQAQIYADLEKDKQAAQGGYESEIEALGGSVAPRGLSAHPLASMGSGSSGPVGGGGSMPPPTAPVPPPPSPRPPSAPAPLLPQQSISGHPLAGLGQRPPVQNGSGPGGPTTSAQPQKTFPKEKLAAYAEANNAARARKGLPSQTLDQIQRDLESSGYRVK